MCYGSHDPKYITRDIEARVKTVAEARDKSEEAASGFLSGAWARISGLAVRMLRKDAVNV